MFCIIKSYHYGGVHQGSCLKFNKEKAGKMSGYLWHRKKNTNPTKRRKIYNKNNKPVCIINVKMTRD